MKKVLIVDDTLTTRDDTNAVIQGLGYDTVMASSAKEGLAFLNNNCVDLCIVDNEMVGMTGLQMVDRMRLNHDMTPVIIITSLLPDLSEGTAARLNVKDYLNKNLHSERARRVIVHALGESRPEEEE